MAVSLLDTSSEEPKSKALRYGISAVAFALMLAGAMWWAFRYTPEKHTVEHFMDALLAGDTQQAYKIWQPRGNFSYQDFLSFFGDKGYYSPIKSYRIETAQAPPGGATGVVVVVEISAYSPFPSAADGIKAAQTREVSLWVETSDHSMGFPPP